MSKAADRERMRQLRVRRALVIGAVILTLLVIDIVWAHWERRITPGSATTRITDPITGGYPDYLAALNQQCSQGITPDNNAAPGILAVVGSDAFSVGPQMSGNPQAWLRAVYQAWHLPEPAAAPLFQIYPDWLLEHPESSFLAHDFDLLALNQELENAAHHPWSVEDHPRLAQWLIHNEPAFAALEEACRRPRYYLPLALDDGHTSASAESNMVPANYALGRQRAIATAVLDRAMLNLHGGNWQGFTHDLLLARTLARLIDQQPALVDHLVALIIENNALRAFQVAAAQPLTAAVAEALYQSTLALPELSFPIRAIDTSERYLVLSDTCWIHSAAQVGLSSLIPVNFDAALRRVNDLYDRTVQAYGLPTEPQRRDAFQNLLMEVEALDRAGGWTRRTHPELPFVRLSWPVLAHMETFQTRAIVNRDLALTALALRRIKATTGTFPHALADIHVAGFTPPVDRFTEKPLIFRRQKDGYMLYSVGPDLEDNNGFPQPQTTTQPSQKWDLVIQTDR